MTNDETEAHGPQYSAPGPSQREPIDQVYPPSPAFQQPQPASRAMGFWHHPITRIVLFAIIFVIALFAGLLEWFLVEPGMLHAIMAFNGRALLISEAIQAVSALIAYMAITLGLERKRIGDTGFGPRGFFRDTSAGFLLGAALLSLVIAALAVLGSYRMVGVDKHFAIGLWLATFLFTAIFEETTFRAFVLRVLSERWGPTVGLVGSSVLFGLVHLGNPGPFTERIAGAFFIAAEAGLLMGAAYILTQRIWMSIGIHWAWNFFEGPIFGTGVSGIPAPSLIHAHVHGSPLLTGGGFGPEAGLPCLVIATTGALALIAFTRNRRMWIAPP